MGIIKNLLLKFCIFSNYVSCAYAYVIIASKGEGNPDLWHSFLFFSQSVAFQTGMDRLECIWSKRANLCGTDLHWKWSKPWHKQSHVRCLSVKSLQQSCDHGLSTQGNCHKFHWLKRGEESKRELEGNWSLVQLPPAPHLQYTSQLYCVGCSEKTSLSFQEKYLVSIFEICKETDPFSLLNCNLATC